MVQRISTGSPFESKFGYSRAVRHDDTVYVSGTTGYDYTWFILTRKIRAKFGADKAERVRWYAAMRALQLRPLRLPKPQVKRGQYPS